MLQLRPHQSEVVEKIRQGFSDGHRCQLLYAPTGFGKTEVAMAIMKAVSESFKKTAMVMDRIVLVDQTSQRLDKYNIDHGVMQSTHWRHRPHERIQICSAQTLEKRKHFPDINLLIIDECHIARRGVNKFIENNPHIKVIGLTASPFTKGLGNIYTHIVGAKSTGDLVTDGWLCPLRVFIAKEIDMQGAKKVAGEWSADEVSERGIKITGDIVTEWEKKTYEIYGKPAKTIVFCSGVAHGRHLKEKFAEHGHRFESISYKEDDEFKKEMIQEFSKPDSEIVGLIATDILTRGFDVTDVMIGVSARPFSKSFSSHVQQLGRIMRTHPGKEFGLWLDHSGNYLRFKGDWDSLYEEGVSKLDESGEKAKPEPTEREKKDLKCPECNALWTSKTDKCDNCGHIRKRASSVVNIEGELEELAVSNAKLSISPQDLYSELLYYARIKGIKDGWAYHKVREKFGVFPRGLLPISKEPSTETLKWIKSRAIAYRKGQEKMNKVIQKEMRASS
jgi:superfamily II DNA or RNA helicase